MQGAAGAMGAQGSTQAGVAGAVGRAGDAGLQGSVGATGAQGSTQIGVAGVLGRAGDAGPQGEVGSTGAQGPAGVVGLWTLYRELQFGYDRSDLQGAEVDKVSEIARYMKDNPSLKIGIDGSMDPRGTDPRNQNLSDRRVCSVRDALIRAGVPTAKIQTGAFRDAQLARDRQVVVLICTDN
jgi:outer membrane protein OmpA-like peptidoglycan-associated protein